MNNIFLSLFYFNRWDVDQMLMILNKIETVLKIDWEIEIFSVYKSEKSVYRWK